MNSFPSGGESQVTLRRSLAAKLSKSANLSDLADPAAARANLGAGTGGGDLLAANNLSDLPSAATARTNLGLGSAAVTPSTNYATASHAHPQSDITNLVSDLAGKAATAHAHAQADITNLVSDLAAKAPASHAHAAADTTSGVFDPARLGSGATGTKFLRGDSTFQTIAGGGDLLAANNLSDLASAATSRTNLGVPSGSGTSSGTNTGDQTITLTGDVTGSGTGSFAATIATGAVTLPKMADIATAKVIGRTAAGTGPPEALPTTGTGNVALSTSPVFTTPNIGAATGSVTGNAGSATALQTARNINGVAFDGTANITVTAAGSTLSDTVPLAKGGTGATDAAGARTALELGTAAVLNVPASGNAAAGEVVKGSDTRLTDARAPTSHTHPQSEVTNLVTDLAGKAATGHTHAQGDVTNLVTDLAGKAAASHVHAAADVTTGQFPMARLASGTPNGAKFIRDDGTLATPAGAAPAFTAVTKDLGAARKSGTFDITGLSGLTADKFVLVKQSAAPIASKGNARDEIEFDPIQATGYVFDATTIRVHWNASGVVVGDYNFAYLVSA